MAAGAALLVLALALGVVWRLRSPASSPARDGAPHLDLRGRAGDPIVGLLEAQLAAIGPTAGAQRTLLAGDPRPKPSDSARALAALVPDSAGAYALALRAIADGRFDAARRLLDGLLAGAARGARKAGAEPVRVERARADAEFYAARFDSAAAWYERALAREPDDPALLTGLGRAYARLAQYPRAEPLFARAIAVEERTLGRDDPAVTASMNDLAELYFGEGKNAAGEGLLWRALERAEMARRDGPDVAVTLTNLAKLYTAQGRYATAEPLLRRAVTIAEGALGGDHPYTAASLENLAAAYYGEHKYAQAESLFRRVLAIRERALGPNHPDVGLCLDNLAALYQAQGRYGPAEAYRRRALGILETALGPDDPRLAIALDNLASLYTAEKRYAAAEPVLRRALAIMEKSLGPDHPDLAIGLNNLAELYTAQGQDERAAPVLRRALAAAEKALGPAHPTTRQIRANYAKLLRRQAQRAAGRRPAGAGL